VRHAGGGATHLRGKLHVAAIEDSGVHWAETERSKLAIRADATWDILYNRRAVAFSRPGSLRQRPECCIPGRAGVEQGPAEAKHALVVGFTAAVDLSALDPGCAVCRIDHCDGIVNLSRLELDPSHVADKVHPCWHQAIDLRVAARTADGRVHGRGGQSAKDCGAHVHSRARAVTEGRRRAEELDGKREDRARDRERRLCHRPWQRCSRFRQILTPIDWLDRAEETERLLVTLALRAAKTQWVLGAVGREAHVEPAVILLERLVEVDSLTAGDAGADRGADAKHLGRGPISSACAQLDMTSSWTTDVHHAVDAEALGRYIIDVGAVVCTAQG
jgi:hypothetical protein